MRRRFPLNLNSGCDDYIPSAINNGNCKKMIQHKGVVRVKVNMKKVPQTYGIWSGGICFIQQNFNNSLKFSCKMTSDCKPGKKCIMMLALMTVFLFLNVSGSQPFQSWIFLAASQSAAYNWTASPFRCLYHVPWWGQFRSPHAIMASMMGISVMPRGAMAYS